MTNPTKEALAKLTQAPPPPDPEFIVAELSKTWTGCGDDALLISQDLERVIAVNLQRGYLLYSFAHSQVMVREGQQQETIIAVFRKRAQTATEASMREQLRDMAGRT